LTGFPDRPRIIPIIPKAQLPGDLLAFPGGEANIKSDFRDFLFFVGPEDLDHLKGPLHDDIISYWRL
jgi:hypothetical protein